MARCESNLNARMYRIDLTDRTMIPFWSQPAVHVGHFTLFAHGILLLLGTLVT
jgi:hypothetical protein